MWNFCDILRLSQPTIQSGPAQAVLDQLADLKDPFAPPIEGLPEHKPFNINGFYQNCQPIESFKWSDGEDSLTKLDEAHIFRSSGTSDTGFSRSPFSSDGLEMYRVTSVATFLNTLSRFFTQSLKSLQGYSLVPTIDEWPTSSLAQMIHWVSDLVPIEFISMEELPKIGASSSQPIWLFGTAFHYINAIDSGFASNLPSGSVLIETGGTKGKSRSVSRDQLYSEMKMQFSIDEQRIISEYGMCELASQAYDFVDPQSNFLTRKFRFPAWVQTTIKPGRQPLSNSGKGALCLYDPVRIDFPYILRTQDVAELASDGFQLLGRMEGAPLKGCSLLAESVLAPTYTSLGQTNFGKAVLPEKLVRTAIDSILNSQTLLVNEFGSLQQSVDIQAQLTEQIVTCAWNEMKVATEDQHWLVLLPHNHSLVGIYPILVGLMTGRSLSVRIPESLQNSLVTSFVQDLKAAGAPIQQLHPKWRLGPHQPGLPYDFNHILAYGSDKTIQSIEQLTSIPCQGFGTNLAISVISDPANLPLLAKDAFSLNQRGCMSTRLAISTFEFSDRHKATLEQSSIPFVPDQKDALEMALESISYECRARGFDCELTNQGPVIALLKDDEAEKIMGSILFDSCFVLPVIYSKNHAATLAKILEAYPQIGLITSDLELQVPSQIQTRALGNGQTPPWDGSHFGRPLFAEKQF